MGTAVLAARFVLAAVFVVAGAGKLLDLNASRRALSDFGVPEPIVGPAGTLVPLAELATACALLIRPSARPAAVAAAVLMIVFAAGIANVLRRGEAPDCNCFGTIHSAPASRGQVARNIALAGVGGFIIGEGPGPTINGWIAARGASQLIAVILAVLILVLIALVLQTWAANRRLRGEVTEAREIVRAIPPGLPVGALAPNFEVRDQTGAAVTLDRLRARGQPVALVFVSPGCGPCAALTPDFYRWQEVLGARLTVGVVGLGALERFEAEATRLQATLAQVLAQDPDLEREVDELHHVLEAYRVQATPSAVIVTSDGTIASATVDGHLAIEALLRLTLTGRGAVGVAVGQTVAA